MNARFGQATLSFVLLVSGVIIEIAIAGSIIAFFLSGAGLGERLSARALGVAQAGIRDAQMRITRNKELCSSGCTSLTPLSYVISMGEDSANVSIILNFTDFDNYIFTIASIGTASTRKKKFESVLVVNKMTGVVQLKSFEELSVL